MLFTRPILGRAGLQRATGGPLVNRWASLALPVLVFLVICFALPLVIIAARSVTELPADARGDVLVNFKRFFTGEANLRVLGTTFWVAALSTLACLVIGYPYAYLMTIASPRWTGVLLIGVLVPFWSSLLVRTYAWQVILRDTGLINSTLLDWGVIRQPLPLFQTTTGVLLGMTQVLLPYMVLPLYTTMARIDPELTTAAANLGASPARAFLRVFFPLSIPGVLAGSLLVFVLALGFYVTPALLGSPKDTMLSAFIATRVQQQLDWGLASAMALVLVALALLVLFLASRVIRVRDVFGALDTEER
jgi:putative spermidine/putrescine transport system permease protein